MATQPPEFNPELNSDFLARLTQGYDQQAREEEGRVRSEQAARGLSGQFNEDSLVSGVRAEANRGKSGAISDFNYRLAGMARDERLTKEGRQYDTDTWRERDAKEFSERQTLAQMGYNFQTGMLGAEQGFERVQGQQGLVAGAAAQAGSSLLGKLIGSEIGGYGGGK